MSAPRAGMSRPVPRHKPVSLPPAYTSAFALIRIAPGGAGLFRYLLEAQDNLAFFTVLDPGEGLFKLVFSPHQKAQVMDALASMRDSVEFEVCDWSAPPGGAVPSALPQG